MTERYDAIYGRVSKGSQDLASQMPDLKRWEAANDVQAKWFTDKATGKTMSRPNWDRLEEAINAGKVKTVVVWRLDRLGRTASGLTALFDLLIAKKVNLISLRDGLDLSTPAGRLMAGVLASVAQYETEVRAERVHAGLAVAKAEGRILGRPKGSKTAEKHRTVKADRRDLVKKLASEGMPKSQIATATGLSRPTVYAILAE